MIWVKQHGTHWMQLVNGLVYGLPSSIASDRIQPKGSSIDISVNSPYGGFRSHGGTPKSSKSWMTILVLKPMVLEIPHVKNPSIYWSPIVRHISPWILGFLHPPRPATKVLTSWSSGSWLSPQQAISWQIFGSRTWWRWWRWWWLPQWWWLRQW